LQPNEILGKGQFGKVVMASSKADPSATVAVKLIDKLQMKPIEIMQ
jgi:hypothetical protein